LTNFSQKKNAEKWVTYIFADLILDDANMITNLKDELKIRDDQITVLNKKLEEAKLVIGGVSFFSQTKKNSSELQGKIESLEEHNEKLVEQGQDGYAKVLEWEKRYNEEKARSEAELKEKLALIE
jgi:hypothetical protein